jgi:hypothetical protein
MPHAAGHTMMSKDMEQCVQECLNCYSVCTATIQHCLQMGGKHADAKHINIMRDCAEICRTSADFMLRGSTHHAHICGECADICRECEKSCRAMGDDQMMQQCAEACRKCAESCQRMAGMGKMA